MIPSQNKKFNENLAKEILQYYSKDYSKLENFEKPDLIDKKASLGVEVTSDFPNKEWKRILSDKNIIRCVEELNKIRVIEASTLETKDAILKKLNKSYTGFKKMELFVFIFSIEYCEEWISELLNFWIEKQNNSLTRFDKLFLFSDAANILWELDAVTKKSLKKQFPIDFVGKFREKYDALKDQEPVPKQ